MADGAGSQTLGEVGAVVPQVTATRTIPELAAVVGEVDVGMTAAPSQSTGELIRR